MRPSHNCHCTCAAPCMASLAFYTSTDLCIFSSMYHPSVRSQYQSLYYRLGLRPHAVKREQLPYEYYTYLSQTRNTNQENRLDKHQNTDRHTQTLLGTHANAQAMHTHSYQCRCTHRNTHTITHAHIQCTFKRARHRRIHVSGN